VPFQAEAPVVGVGKTKRAHRNTGITAMGYASPSPAMDWLKFAGFSGGDPWGKMAADKLRQATRLATEVGLSTSTQDRNRRQLISIGRSVMRRPATSALALLLTSAAASADDIVLRGMGSLHVGGRIVELNGRPVREIVRVPGGPSSKLDPNGQYQVEQMYAQYFLPKHLKGKVPLLMWHGGGLTGVTYETTPDGREGWLNMFLRKGWDVYVSDAVERGRSGFASPEVWPGEPIFLPYADPFERFRIGEGDGSWNEDPAKQKLMPGVQFPVSAYANYMKQIVPRWLSTDDAVIAGYIALVDKVCPCVLLTHSQGGSFGLKVAEARADKVKAVVAVEPASGGNPDKAAALNNIPVLMLFGDNVDLNPRWVAYRKLDLEYAAAVRAAGGKADVINLPDLGIKGNSHMVMMDKNNDAVADVIEEWLKDQGLTIDGQ
jgi:pimeloyl-ACP methyl ester carboxylesterase